jgi:regulator of PEP synthase PpsR (kinase-PPPase family)
MSRHLSKALKEKNAKLLVIDSTVEKRIRKLMERFDTSALDVVAAATNLLSQAAGKKIILRDPSKKYDIVIDSLEKSKDNQND